MGCPRPNVPNKNAKILDDLAEPLRSMMHTAIIRAKAEGLTLYLVSGARSDGQQWDLRHGRVPAGQECNPAFKGVPTTAIPGRSHHRNLSATICAADMGGALSWLHTHATDLGIHFPVPGEAWHAEPTGSRPRWTIIPFGSTAAPDGGHEPPPYPGHPLRARSTGDDVVRFKFMAHAAGRKGFSLTPTGIRTYGIGTERMVRRFQKDHHLKVDGIVGRDTWNKMRDVVNGVIARKAKG